MTDDTTGRKTQHDWLARYWAALHGGALPHELPWPQTRDELLAADDAGLLAMNQQWIPGQQGLRMLGLPDHFGRPLASRNDLWCEQHLQTLLDRPDYRAALKALLSGGAI